MKKIYLIIIFIIIFLYINNNFINGINDNIILKIRSKLPQGTFYTPGQKCYLKWDFIDTSNGTKVKLKKIKYYNIFIIQSIEGKDVTLKIDKVSPKENRYIWKIPLKPLSKIYKIIIRVNPYGIEGDYKVYVKKDYYSLKKFKIKNLRECLKILMDWRGHRGYYTKVHPKLALEIAKKACKWIRKRYKEYFYKEYEETINGIEKCKIYPIKIYCREYKALLKIDNCSIGIFEELSSIKKGYYYLLTYLPADKYHPYKIYVIKNKRQKIVYYTHVCKSTLTIDSLYEILSLKINAKKIKIKVKSEGKDYTPNWDYNHIIFLYKKPQVIYISVKKGPVLKVYLYPTEDLEITIEKEYNNYILIKNGKKYFFIGNELNLLF